MKFSIVTCTWNSAATLLDTLRSVRSQTHPDVEHIFVDGGSSDGTLQMIATQCPGAKLLTGVSGGISRAMNAGILAATGDVIAHLHSDDFYAADDVLARVAGVMYRSQAKWAFGDMDVLRNNIRSPASRRRTAYTPSAYARGSVAILHPTVFVSRDMFETVGLFDETLRYAMDIDLWLRIGPLYRPAELPFTVAVFRAHAGSLSTANPRAARAEESAVRRRYFAHWPIDTLVCAARHTRMQLRQRWVAGAGTACDPAA